MILVVGGTGRLGGQIVQRLLADGRKVRVLVRPPSDYGSLVQAGAEPVVGDLKDPASLHAACEGIDAVITTANAAGRGGEDTFQTVDDEGNHNLIKAAVQAGVKRFIFTSVLGSDSDSPAPLLRAKGITEERLRASGMTFTITQADVHMDMLIPLVVDLPLSQGEPVRVVGEGRRQHSFVAQQDVAAFTVAALEHPAARNNTIVIGGPEPLSWRDIAGTVERELGRPVRLETIPVGQRLPGVPDFVTDLVTALEMYDTPLDMRETTSIYGVDPTSLTEWVRQRFAVATAEACGA
ncbi:MAG: SDR family oxidoreductase [Candidatus Limnocylindria bacterium]